MTTWFNAGVSSAHLELAPQVPPQSLLSTSWFIEPETSSTMRMSGGSLFSG